MSIGSTTIGLSVMLFDWANFRRKQRAIKLNLLLDHDGYLPSFVVISEAKLPNLKVLPEFSLALWAAVGDDRGNTDPSLRVPKRLTLRFKGMVIDLWVDRDRWHRGGAGAVFLEGTSSIVSSLSSALPSEGELSRSSLENQAT